MNTEAPVLIIGNSADYHAVAVAWALREMGTEALIWDGISSDSQGRLNIHPTSMSFSLSGVPYERLKSFWFRRQVPYKPLAQVNPDAVKFIKREMIDAHHSLAVIAKNISKFVVGSNYAYDASSKAYQLTVAASCGFKVPETIFSNDYDCVRKFAQGKRVVVKHFAPHYFMSRSGGGLRAIGPKVFDEITIDLKDSINACPSIYQELVDKAFDLRVTVIGRRIYCAKLEPCDEETNEALDWRPHYGTSKLRVSSHYLDPLSQEKILAIMNSLGLAYGCLDFAVGKNNELSFLEVNPGGQFLFIEDEVESFNLLYSFSSMLHQASLDWIDNRRLIPLISMEKFEASSMFDDWKKKNEECSRDEKFLTMVD